jgi:hypothetical protein
MWRFTSILLLLLSLVACGGGGGGGGTPVSSTTPPPVSQPDPVPTEVKLGTITGFGSIFVNGIRYETDDDTDYGKDDSDASEDDFAVGMMVRVRSRSQNTIGERIAERVEYDEDIEGPVDEVNGDVLVVFGQTVLTTDASFDDGLSVSDIRQGDILEISGQRGPDDELVASYIERKADVDVDEYEVRGQVRELDEVAQTFVIGGLEVDYSLAFLDDLDDGIADGMLVEVEDADKSYQPQSLVVVATEVEGEDRLEFRDDDENDRERREDDYEIEGLISSVDTDSSSFFIGEVLVVYSATTLFEFGTADDLAPGVKVEAEGDRLADGGIRADKIKFSRNAARVSGLVETVDEEAMTLEVLDVVIHVSDATEVEDDRSDAERFADLMLMANEFVEVEGVQDGNTIRAFELEREDDADDDSELRGVLQGFDETAGTVRLFGVTINTDGQTEYSLDDDIAGEDQPISREDFYQLLHVDQTLLKAKWDGPASDSGLPVKELSIED